MTFRYLRLGAEDQLAAGYLPHAPTAVNACDESVEGGVITYFPTGCEDVDGRMIYAEEGHPIWVNIPTEGQTIWGVPVVAMRGPKQPGTSSWLDRPPLL